MHDVIRWFDVGSQGWFWIGAKFVRGWFNGFRAGVTAASQLLVVLMLLR